MPWGLPCKSRTLLNLLAGWDHHGSSCHGQGSLIGDVDTLLAIYGLGVHSFCLDALATGNIQCA